MAEMLKKLPTYAKQIRVRISLGFEHVMPIF